MITKTEIINWVLANKKSIQETMLFGMILSSGTIVKIVKFKNAGNDITFSFVLTEILMSILVGALVYAIFDQFLEANQLLTCVVCAWCSSFSTIFHARMEKLLIKCFDWIEQIFNTKTPEL